MSYTPRRTKYRKMHKGKIGGSVGNSVRPSFGAYAFQACAGGRVSSACLEAVRRVMSRCFRRSGQIWIRRFPDVVQTQKPLEVRMGKGKGNPSGWVAIVRPGQILFEISGATPAQLTKARRLMSVRLPFPIRLLENT